MYFISIFLSVIGSCLAGLFGRHLGSWSSAFIAISCLFLSFLISLFAFYQIAFIGCFVYIKLTTWISSEIPNACLVVLFHSFIFSFFLVLLYFIVYISNNLYLSKLTLFMLVFFLTAGHNERIFDFYLYLIILPLLSFSNFFYCNDYKYLGLNGEIFNFSFYKFVSKSKIQKQKDVGILKNKTSFNSDESYSSLFLLVTILGSFSSFCYWQSLISLYISVTGLYFLYYSTHFKKPFNSEIALYEFYLEVNTSRIITEVFNSFYFWTMFYLFLIIFFFSGQYFLIFFFLSTVFFSTICNFKSNSFFVMLNTFLRNESLILYYFYNDFEFLFHLCRINFLTCFALLSSIALSPNESFKFYLHIFFSGIILTLVLRTIIRLYIIVSNKTLFSNFFLSLFFTCVFFISLLSLIDYFAVDFFLLKEPDFFTNLIRNSIGEPGYYSHTQLKQYKIFLKYVDYTDKNSLLSWNTYYIGYSINQSVMEEAIKTAFENNFFKFASSYELEQLFPSKTC